VGEALTEAQFVRCPSCNAGGRKDEACIHMSCREGACKTEWCYCCGQGQQLCPRGAGGCDEESCFLDSNSGWSDFGRGGETAAKGALLEFHRRLMAWRLRQLKQRPPFDDDALWTRLRREQPELLSDVIEGRSITFEQIDSATMPLFGARRAAAAAGGGGGGGGGGSELSQPWEQPGAAAAVAAGGGSTGLGRVTDETSIVEDFSAFKEELDNAVGETSSNVITAVAAAAAIWGLFKAVTREVSVDGSDSD